MTPVHDETVANRPAGTGPEGADWAEALLDAEGPVLQMMGEGREVGQVLEALCRMTESLCPGATCSVFLLDTADGRLRWAAAPSLPREVTEAVESIPVGPGGASCGLAAATGDPVVCPDIAADPLWDRFAPIAASLGLRACVSTPFRSSVGAVLGTFATYFGEARRPTDLERRVARRAAKLAAIAAESSSVLAARRRAEQSLRESEATLRAFYDNSPALAGVVEPTDDGDLVHLYDNPATCRYFGVEPGSTAGRLASEMGVSPATLAPWLDGYRESRRRGGPVRFEFAAPGGDCWLSVSVCPIGDSPSGRPRFSYLAEDVTERRRLAEQLEAERSLLGAFFDSTTVALGLVDTEFRYLRANEALARTNGLPVADHLGRTVAEILPRLWPTLEPLLRRVIETGEPLRGVEIEGETPRTPGESQSWVVNYDPVRIDGRIVGLSFALVETTEARRREARLRSAEERLRLAVDATGLGIWDADPSLDTIAWSGAMRAIYGLPPGAEVSVARIRPMIHPRDLAAFDRANLAALDPSGDGLLSVEHRIVRPDRSVRWVALRGRCLFTGEGPARRPDRFVGTALDITERKAAEERVREAERRFRSAFEQAAVGMAHVALDGRWLLVNKTLCDLVGYTADELLARTFQDITHPDDLDADLAQSARLVVGSIATYSMEKRYVRADGSIAWVDLTVALVRDDEGLPLYFSAVIQDIGERKRAEAELRRSEERSRTILESITDAFFAVDRSWRFTYVNRQAERLLARDAGELLGRVIWAEFAPAVGTEFERSYRRAMAENVTISFEAYYAPLDRWYEVRAYPSADGLAVYFRDATERRKHEAALRVSELRYRSLVDAASAIVWDTPASGEFEADQPGWRAFTGQRPDELLGWGWLDAVHPDDRAATTAAWIASLASRAPCEIEHRLRRADGTYRHMTARAVPIPDEGGAVREWVGVHADVTEARLAEARLRESEARFRQLADAMPQIVWVAAPDGRIEYYNRRWYEHTGLAPEESLGDGWTLPLHPEDRPRAARLWDRSLRTGEPYEIEYRIRSAGGDYRWFLGRALPARDDEGRIVGWFGTCTDVTASKQVEEALKDSDRRKDEFLATLAHELRNPLASIRTALHLMGSDPAGSSAERAMAERQVVHLTRLIDDLMDVARISRGKIQLRTRALDLAAVVAQAVETARPLVDARGHRLSVNLPDGPIRIVGDPTRLEQVFWNLLNNAAKYTEPGGRIELTVAREAGEVVARVRDTGIGIPAESLPGVFDMFVQVEQHAAQSHGGLGIGLGLVRSLVEMHGGTIAARSDGPGLGSEFVVHLPAGAATNAELTAPRPSAVGYDLRALPRRRILIVDDNADAADVLAKVLSRLHGQDVRVVHDGLGALEVAEGFRPEVVLLDLGMPGLDGLEVARRLRARPEFEGTTLVALTGWGQESDRQKTRDAGFDRHLVKPVDPDDLRPLLLDPTRRGG